MPTTFQIIAEGRVYVHTIYSRRELTFETTIEQAHKLLQGKSKASAFDALYKGITESWLLRDDIVQPFGDRRQNWIFVCTLNLDQDLLLYSEDLLLDSEDLPLGSEESSHIQLPLARLREPSSDPVQRSEFTPFEIASPSQLNLSKFPPPYQIPLTPIPERRLAFSSRILSDFARQWRHILRSSYAESTFRRLAKAIISIATCDFQIDELSSTRLQINAGRPYVYILDVPSWKPYEHQVFSTGGTTVILHQDLQTALQIAKNKAKGSINFMNPDDHAKQRMYLLLSVRYMLVCRVDSTGTFSYTAPTTLMDGLTLPSPSAINLLLQALSPSRPPPRTPVHNLPVEIQDRILEHVSEGRLEAARLGCILGLGSPFTWMRAHDLSRTGGPIRLFTIPSHRMEYSPVESKIRFRDVFSGVSYR